MTDAEIMKAILTKIGPEKIAMMAPATYGSVIFSHEFAKALWGNEQIHVRDEFSGTVYMEAWAYHLQQMVVKENPVKYLEKFI